jgi:hypothetical protein
MIHMYVYKQKCPKKKKFHVRWMIHMYHPHVYKQKCPNTPVYIQLCVCTHTIHKSRKRGGGAQNPCMYIYSCVCMRIHREKDTDTNQDKHTQKNTHTHWGLHAAVDDLFLDPLLSKIPNTALSVSLSLSISLSLSLSHSLSLSRARSAARRSSASLCFFF